MNTRVGITLEKKSRSVANDLSQQHGGRASVFQFVDHRSEAIAQRELQQKANISPQVKQARQLQTMADNASMSTKASPLHAMMDNQFNSTKQLIVCRTIQRAEGDEHVGSVQVKPSDRSICINVAGAIRPWFNLPEGSDLIVGDTVSFTEGADRAVTDLAKTGHVQTEEERTRAIEALRAESDVVCDHGEGVVLTEYDIEHGAWRQLIGERRRDTDYELVVQLGGVEYSYHFHAPNYAGRRPTPGQVMRDGRMTDTQTPSAVLDAVMRLRGRPDGY